MIFFIPSRILKLTLDTDLKEDTPSIPVFFCFWMHYYYTYYHISRGVYHFHSRVFCHIWDGSCKTHFGLQENGLGCASTIFLESKSVFYSYHPIYGRKLDYGNNIHPCFQICALMADISGRNLQLWWSWPWCSSVFSGGYQGKDGPAGFWPARLLPPKISWRWVREGL